MKVNFIGESMPEGVQRATGKPSGIWILSSFVPYNKFELTKILKE